MPLTIPAGFAQIILGYSLDDSSHLSSSQFACQLGGPIDVLGEGIATAWKDTMLSTTLFSGHWSGTKVTINTDTETYEAIVNQAGSGGFEPCASSLCVLAKKVTGLRGRANSGRMFLPAGYLDEGDVAANGQIGADLVSALQSMMGDFGTAVSGVSGFDAPAILHSNPATLPTPFVGFDIEGMCASQRKRMPRT